MTRPGKKRHAPGPDFWCAWGRHRTWKHEYLREKFPAGTMCMSCQFKIVENVEAALPIPAVTEAIARQGRARYEVKKQDARLLVYRQKVAPDADGWVYYIRINGRIKIGYTANLRQRSRHYPPGSELLAAEPGTRDLERRRHQQFSRDLAQGREWFAESDRLAAHISETARTHGVPTTLMHSFTKHEGIKHV